MRDEKPRLEGSLAGQAVIVNNTRPWVVLSTIRGVPRACSEYPAQTTRARLHRRPLHRILSAPYDTPHLSEILQRVVGPNSKFARDVCRRVIPLVLKVIRLMWTKNVTRSNVPKGSRETRAGSCAPSLIIIGDYHTKLRSLKKRKDGGITSHVHRSPGCMECVE